MNKSKMKRGCANTGPDATPGKKAVAMGAVSVNRLFDQMIEATPPASATKLAAAGRRREAHQ